jgi:hypothetical protein
LTGRKSQDPQGNLTVSNIISKFTTFVSEPIKIEVEGFEAALASLMTSTIKGEYFSQGKSIVL